MAKKNTGNGVGAAVAVGAGIAVASAAAYLLFGPEGKKHRKDMQSWMIKMKAEVMEKMEKAKELSTPVYEKIISDVEAKYGALKHVDSVTLKKEVDELKKNWRAMTKAAKGAKKSVKKVAKK
jgi:hypothetical protein